MSRVPLGKVERKVYGALLTLADDELYVSCKKEDIAKRMGYKRSGGAITNALRILEHHNYIMLCSDGKILVFT